MNTQPTHDLPVDRETAQADREIKHLKKTLGRLDIVFLIVAAVVSIEALGQVSGFGAETFTWTLVLAVTSRPPMVGAKSLTDRPATPFCIA